MKQPMKQVKLAHQVDQMLCEISRIRKQQGQLNSTKQSIVGELITALYKKETKGKKDNL